MRIRAKKMKITEKVDLFGVFFQIVSQIIVSRLNIHVQNYY